MTKLVKLCVLMWKFVEILVFNVKIDQIMCFNVKMLVFNVKIGENFAFFMVEIWL